MKILIADDSEKNRELLRTVLGHLGHNVIEAADGAEAVAAAKAERPDLIVLDLQMPVLDGYGAVRALRTEPEFAVTPILALTAYAMDNDRERALAAGFTSYLTKPLRLAVLRQEISQWER